jgi:hypothetical protein
VTRWLTGQINGLSNIELKLNTEATPEVILHEAPDAVVVATGSRPKEQAIPGEYGPPVVVNAWQVLNEEVHVGDKVLIIDTDGHHICGSVAEFLADKGRSVHILTPALFVGGNLGPVQDFHLSRQRLIRKNVTFTPDVAVIEIQGALVKGVQVYSGEFVEYDGYDTIVLVMGNQSNDEIYHALKGRVPEIHRIGDCVAPRKTDMAILEGHLVGRRI